MTMLEADSYGSEVLGDRFGHDVDFVEGCSLPRQGTGDFVNKNRASKTAICLKTSRLRGGKWYVRNCLPPSDKTPLGPTDGDVVTNDKELDFVCPAWVPGSESFFRQTKVEDISGVVPRPDISCHERTDTPRRYT